MPAVAACCLSSRWSPKALRAVLAVPKVNVATGRASVFRLQHDKLTHTTTSKRLRWEFPPSISMSLQTTCGPTWGVVPCAFIVAGTNPGCTRCVRLSVCYSFLQCLHPCHAAVYYARVGTERVVTDSEPTQGKHDE